MWSHLPLNVMLMMLVMEKHSQKWVRNKGGCTMERLRMYKTLDEKLLKISEGKPPHPINREEDCPIPRVYPKSQNISVGEAEQEIARIEWLFREQTEKMKEDRLKTTLIKGLKRKYYSQYQGAMKMVVEQLSLLLLLLSCVVKTNVISVLYLFLLLIFLFIRNKPTGMLIMSITFSVLLLLQYLINLTNLCSFFAPQEFPLTF